MKTQFGLTSVVFDESGRSTPSGDLNATSRMKSRKTAIAFLPGETAGFVCALASGFSASGWSPEIFFLASHPFSYETTFFSSRSWLRAARGVHHRFKRSKGMRRLMLRSLTLVLCAIGTVDIAIRFRVVVVNNGRGFLPLSLDLVILRLARCSVIACHCHGSASRSAWSNCLNREDDFDPQTLRRNAKRVEREVRRSTLLSSHTLGSQTLRELVPKQHWRIEELGFPVQLPITHARTKVVSERPLIVHIPSDPEVKGSQIIRNTVASLEGEFPFEYREYRNLKRIEAVSIFGRASLVIDQLYADRRFSVTAAECALLGTPCFIYGYAGTFSQMEPDMEEAAGILKRPEYLSVDLRRFLSDQSKFLEQASQLRLVAERFFDPERIAQEILSSMSDPPTIDFGGEISYRLGAGSSATSLTRACRLRVASDPTAAHEMFIQLAALELPCSRSNSLDSSGRETSSGF